MCISADYILVHSSLIDEFIEGIQQAWLRMFGQNPEESADYSRIVNDFHMDRLERLINTAGGKIICGGNLIKDQKYVAPTLILMPDKDSELMTDEIFGPIMPVLPFDDFSEAVSLI